MIKYILKQPDGSTFNPMTMDEIRMMAEEGSLSSAHSLQIQGGTEWHPISKIQGLLPESRMPKASQSTVQSIASSQFKNIKADELYKKSVVKLSSASSLLKNKKATIIIGAAFILVLIFLLSSSTSNDINSYLIKFERAQESLFESSRQDNPVLFLDTLEEVSDLMTEMSNDSENIIQEINNMTPNERLALEVRFAAMMKRTDDNFRAQPGGDQGLMFEIMSNPDHLTRMQDLMIRMESWEKNNPFLELE